jgi:hypothetical protein
MDLNRPPSNVSDFPSSLDIRIVTRKKVDCRNVLVRRYGQEGYNAMLNSPEPVILPTVTNFMIVIFVLYN